MEMFRTALLEGIIDFKAARRAAAVGDIALARKLLHEASRRVGASQALIDAMAMKASRMQQLIEQALENIDNFAPKLTPVPAPGGRVTWEDSGSEVVAVEREVSIAFQTPEAFRVLTGVRP